MSANSESSPFNNLPFYQVDVFSSEPYKGNPVAVTIIEDEQLTDQFLTQKGKGFDDHLQRFAVWTNLSETTFIFPFRKGIDEEEVDYNIRIFTPGCEIPFAGHPTLGSCKAWLSHGNKPKQEGVVVQKCELGLIKIKISSQNGKEFLSFSAPPLRRKGEAKKEEIEPFCKAMDFPIDQVLQSEWIVNGPDWCFLRLKDAKTVLDIEVKDPLAAGKGLWGVIGHYEKGEHPDGASFEVRTFAPSDGILEDPITGSFTAGLAIWMQNSKSKECLQQDGKISFIVSQGSQVGRLGRLYVQEDDQGTIWIGGQTLVCIKGNVIIP